MEVILIRHLATPGNEKRQYIGRTDEPLSGCAVSAFREQQGGPAAVPYPRIQCLAASPMRRCQQTAELIWPEVTVQTDPLLRECDFGRFEGKTYEDLKDEPDYIRWMESGGMTAFPEGESQEDFRARCEPELVQEPPHVLLAGDADDGPDLPDPHHGNRDTRDAHGAPELLFAAWRCSGGHTR